MTGTQLFLFFDGALFGALLLLIIQILVTITLKK
jgi:hypothetical protein